MKTILLAGAALFAVAGIAHAGEANNDPFPPANGHVVANMAFDGWPGYGQKYEMEVPVTANMKFDGWPYYGKTADAEIPTTAGVGMPEAGNTEVASHAAPANNGG